MDNDALGKQIVNNILDSLQQYKEIVAMTKKYNEDTTISQQRKIEDITSNIQSNMIALATAGGFNKNIMEVLMDGIKDQEFDVEFIKQILITDNVFNTNTSKSTLQMLKMAKDDISSVLFGKDACTDSIIREITRQKLTLIAYNTKDGFKFTLCSPQNIDKTLSRILPNVVYNNNIKINNCAYHGVGYNEFCDKYICNTYNSSKFDIAIIPSISHNSVLQSSTAEDAKRQYKNVYEKIFKFFNNKNVPISLQQTSACKGNNFAFALSDNIEGDTKIDTLEFSTRNIISGMLIPNFHSKYVDTAVKCFYNQNINNLKICFTFPTPPELFLHAIPGSIGYATETISKILEKAENSNKDKQISVLKKILKSFDNTINILIGDRFHSGFMTNNKIAVNDEQFLETLTNMQNNIDSYLDKSTNDLKVQIDNCKTIIDNSLSSEKSIQMRGTEVVDSKESIKTELGKFGTLCENLAKAFESKKDTFLKFFERNTDKNAKINEVKQSCEALKTFSKTTAGTLDKVYKAYEQILRDAFAINNAAGNNTQQGTPQPQEGGNPNGGEEQNNPANA